MGHPGPVRKASAALSLPSDIINRLAINDSGFVFDPVSGQSFTINESGRAILRLARTKRSAREIAEELVAEFEVPLHKCERDVLEFAAVLRRLGN
jgi:hypothetical protein